MENYRNKSRKIVNIKRKLFRSKNSLLFYGFILGIILSAVSLILFLLIPALISSNYYQKSLKPLRKQARTIKNEFAHIISGIKHKQSSISQLSFPTEKNEIFKFLKKFDLNSDIEGIGYYSPDGKLVLWLGNVIDFETISPEENTEDIFQRQKSSFLIKDKASVYLVSSQKVKEKGYIVFYRLLAFSPQFKTSYLKEYQFLKSKLLRNLQNIVYYDFKEDISELNTLFSRHKDEYIGQPALQSEIQTIVFPLRNENEKIVALVNLNSPSLSSYVSVKKESIFLAIHILFGASLVFLLVYLLKTSSFFKERKPFLFSLTILILISLRLIFLPLSRLEKIKSLPIFSPSAASFLSVANLTKSPADIFLTFFFIFLIIVWVVFYFKNYFEKKKVTLSLPLSLLLNLSLILLSLFLFALFQEILRLLIFNSNINLLRFSFTPSSILLHLSVLFLTCSFFLTIFMLLRIASLYSSHFLFSLIIFVLGSGGFFILFEEKYSQLVIPLQIVVILSILLFTFFPGALKRKSALVSVFILGTLFLYISLDYYSSIKSRFLVRNSLKNTVLSQKNWGNFLTDQTLAELDEKREAIISFFRHPVRSGFSQSLWRDTSASKFNWYSSLEIWNSEGEVLSRFSLNVPQLYPSDFTLSFSKDWIISHQSIPFMGKEKNLLVSFKDWFDEGNYLGRMTLTLSADYDMLPFLYSANPYFELIRVTTIPSLNQLNFGFAVFDLDGKLLFNPNKISQGIHPNLIELINSSEDSIWSSFQDKNRKYTSFYFRTDNRIYSFFIPQKNFINYTVEFLKLLFFYTAVFLLFFILISIAFQKKKIKNPLWSFSSKVYASFICIAIIPLLLFTFFTRSFFERIFAQQFIEKAEVHANFAYRVMEDFIFLQQEEKLTPTVPPEELVLLISSMISNDVNLYQEGRLISSSRREFYDSGLLPELIDSEIYYKIQFENKPFYTQKQKIGDYSFHTLTIPFYYLDSLFLISLPFPFEQQEISNASEEFIEFLVFISVFFVGIVLLFARGMGTMIIAPIKKLLTGTKEVGLGNLKVSIDYKPQDEMKNLIDGFNAMIKNLRKHQKELTDMSKKVAWAEMARKVAHEIKNPLTPIQLSAEHLLKVHSDKKGDFDQTLKESASYIIKEVENLRKIAQEFLDISKEKSLKKELFNLRALIQETISPFKKTLSERIKFKEVYEEKDFSYKGDKAKIRIALRNILINAIEAIRNQGDIEIKLRRIKDNIILEIRDTGIGMEKEMREKVFEPSFSTKDVGAGLGLPIARKNIEDHGGSIQISSELGKGTKIMIKFPFLS